MRRAGDRLLAVATALCAAIAVAIFAAIVTALVWRGGGAISWEFLTDALRSGGAAGGVAYHVAGTLILIGAALLVSLPLGLGVALVHGVFLRGERARERCGALLAVLNGVPSILFGLFGLMVFVKFLGWGKSWLTGGILLGLMMFPSVALVLAERIRAMPRRYLDAAAGLGLSQGQTIRSVILPQCAGGLTTGALLGLARAAGETAPLMFTATIFAGATLPGGVRDSPVLTLPYHIFVLSQDTLDPAATQRMWGAALVLLALVMTLSLLALPARMRLHEEARHD